MTIFEEQDPSYNWKPSTIVHSHLACKQFWSLYYSYVFCFIFIKHRMSQLNYRLYVSCMTTVAITFRWNNFWATNKCVDIAIFPRLLHFMFGLRAVEYCNIEDYLTTHIYWLTCKFGFKILICSFEMYESLH